MEELKKSYRLAAKSQRSIQRKELDMDTKRFLICVGRKDKKAFYVDINDKKAFPESDEHLLSSLVERCQFTPGSKFNLYWAADLRNKATLVQAVFFQYADNKSNARILVDRLSTKLDKFDTRSINLSIDTEKIVTACEEESFAEENGDYSLQFEDDDYSEVNDAAKSINENRKGDACRLRALAATGQSIFDNPITENRMLVILNDFKKEFKDELLHDLSRLIKSAEQPQQQLGDVTKEIEEKCNKVVQNGVHQLSKKLTDLLDPTKVAFQSIKLKSHLFGDDEPLPRWTTNNICIKAIINGLYLRFGGEPNELFKALARRMYGDLLCYFKCDIQRIFNDLNRKTRPPLEDFDPNGLKILTVSIDQYAKIHGTDIVTKKTGRQLSSEEFRLLMFGVIDKWSCKAYCKNGRSKPNVECLLLTHLRNGHYIKVEDTDDDRNEILQKFESLKNRRVRPNNATPPSAKKQKITAVLKKGPAASGAMADIHSEDEPD